jgi:hypothetical protein
MKPKRGKTDAALTELYEVLRDNDYRRVLELGQQQLATASDKLAVLEAMLDALENLLFNGGLADPAPIKTLERSLQKERARLIDAGETSDVYKLFLDRTYKGGGD